MNLRHAMPVLAPFLAGALAYLLLGDGPHAGRVAPASDADWSLPAPPQRDAEAARAVWTARAPWGQETGAADAAPDALALAPVGFVNASGRPVALFARADGQVVRAGLGDALPDGSRITELDASGVTWADALGRTQRRAWLVDVVAAPAEEPAAAPRGRAGRTPGQGPGNRGARAGRTGGPGAAREARQRPAPTAVSPAVTRPAPTTSTTQAPSTTTAQGSSRPAATTTGSRPAGSPFGAASGLRNPDPGSGGAAPGNPPQDEPGTRPTERRSTSRSGSPRG